MILKTNKKVSWNVSLCKNIASVVLLFSTVSGDHIIALGGLLRTDEEITEQTTT